MQRNLTQKERQIIDIIIKSLTQNATRDDQNTFYRLTGDHISLDCNEADFFHYIRRFIFNGDVNNRHDKKGPTFDLIDQLAASNIGGLEWEFVIEDMGYRLASQGISR